MSKRCLLIVLFVVIQFWIGNHNELFLAGVKCETEPCLSNNFRVDDVGVFNKTVAEQIASFTHGIFPCLVTDRQGYGAWNRIGTDYEPTHTVFGGLLKLFQSWIAARPNTNVKPLQGSWRFAIISEQGGEDNRVCHISGGLMVDGGKNIRPFYPWQSFGTILCNFPHPMSGPPQTTSKNSQTKVEDELQDVREGQSPPNARRLILWVAGHLIFFLLVRWGIWFDDRGRTDLWWRLFFLGIVQLAICYVLFALTCCPFSWSWPL